MFICQDDDHRHRFVEAADWQLTAYQQRWADLNPAHEYVARDRVLFGIEEHIRAGRPEAVRLPHLPPSSPNRDGRLRGVWLPGAPRHD